MPSPELTQLLATDHPSGVYWLKTHASVAELQKLSRAKALNFFHLEGKKIEKKDQFLNHAAVAMIWSGWRRTATRFILITLTASPIITKASLKR
jgi:hypothetical protein